MTKPIFPGAKPARAAVTKIRADLEAKGELSISAVSQKLVPFKKPKSNPALAYLSTLSEGQSRETMTRSLKSVAGLFKAAGIFEADDIFAAPWEALAFDDVAGLRARMQTLWAPAGANLKLAALKGVLRAAASQGLMTYEAMHRAVSGARKVAGSREVAGKALTKEELRSLFMACDHDPDLAVRDRALLVCLYGLGLRRSEAAGLKFSDMLEKGAVVRVIGKGNKERKQAVPKEALPMFRAWLQRGLVMNESVFGLTAPGIYSRLLRLGEVAGVKVRPHDLRRSYATDLFDLGIDAMVVSRMLGHSNIQTSMRYDRRPESTKKAAADLLTFDWGVEKEKP